MSGGCAFCERMALAKFIEDKIYCGYRHEYTVALVDRHWTRERGKRNAVRGVDFRWRGLGFKLNYCPECGRKLKGAKNAV